MGRRLIQYKNNSNERYIRMGLRKIQTEETTRIFFVHVLKQRDTSKTNIFWNYESSISTLMLRNRRLYQEMYHIIYNKTN